MKETGARIVARTPILAMCCSTSYLLSKCGIPVCRLAEPTDVKTRCTPDAFLLQSGPRLPARLEQPGKSRSHVDEDRGPQYGHKEGQRKPARGHQGVESKDVDNHRRQHCHRQRYVAVEQQKHTCDDLKREDHPQVMRDIKGTHELTSNTRWRGKGNEVQEAVEPPNKKDHARLISGVSRCGSHNLILLFH